MRVVVTGATGNVGTSLLQALADEPAVESVVGIARRRPELELPKTEWAQADVASSELVPLFRGADAVVHLAWLIQPTRNRGLLWHANVDGSTRVFRAAADAGVGALVHASSIGAYSPGPKTRPVDESWPTGGIVTNEYSRYKVEVERRLDRFERDHPEMRIVRLRPTLIFKRESATGQRRLFAGPFLPRALLQPGRLPFVPHIPELVFQAVHSYDAGNAYRLAVVRDVRGAFNIAAPPTLDTTVIAHLLRARTLRMSARTARALAALAWRARLTPIPASWLDMGLGAPLLDTTRAQTELGWMPELTGEQALADLLDGIRDAAGLPTPPLSPNTSGRARIRELATGIGKRP
ncbi:MAG: NAD-dependent epimerase/dehydratase family protein [Gaiellaceae bacterium]